VINTRLFDWYGIDLHKNLNIQNKCPKPFDTVLIDKVGSCYLCECTAWLPQSVGNLHKKSLYEIFNSRIAKTLRNSIIDHSYRYCNSNQCQWIQKNIVENYENNIPKISKIRLAIDDSCNLACLSCRQSKIFLKKGNMLKMRLFLADRINEYLKNVNNVNIHIGSDGDPFVSLVYRHFMRGVPDNESFSFNIQTNGLLIKKMFGRLSNIFNRLKELNISIDGATKKTYELLRKGGNFDLLLENLQFIKQYHKNFQINFHMVVQKLNWHEMSEMINLAEKFNVDKVWFNKIQNWNTYKNFTEHLPPEKNAKFLNEYYSVKKNKKTIIWNLYK
jgi:MoaA/NifB/PqqE/SkfB family radical SAM enzyme